MLLHSLNRQKQKQKLLKLKVCIKHTNRIRKNQKKKKKMTIKFTYFENWRGTEDIDPKRYIFCIGVCMYIASS